MVAGSCRVCHVLQGPLFPVVHKLHERISMVPWGVFRLTTSPFFYLPRGEWVLYEGDVGLREQRLLEVGLPGLRDVAPYESVVLKQLLVL